MDANRGGSIITKSSILDVAAVLDPPLLMGEWVNLCDAKKLNLEYYLFENNS